MEKLFLNNNLRMPNYSTLFVSFVIKLTAEKINHIFGDTTVCVLYVYMQK